MNAAVALQSGLQVGADPSNEVVVGGKWGLKLKHAYQC